MATFCIELLLMHALKWNCKKGKVIGRWALLFPLLNNDHAEIDLPQKIGKETKAIRSPAGDKNG